jgi:hypothetical protein
MMSLCESGWLESALAKPLPGTLESARERIEILLSKNWGL